MVGFLLNVTLYQLEPQGLKVTENLLSIGWHNLGAQRDLGSFSLVCFLNCQLQFKAGSLCGSRMATSSFSGCFVHAQREWEEEREKQ